MIDSNDRLDEAIARRLAGPSPQENDPDPLLAGLDQLDALRDVPPLDLQAAAHGKRVFLTRAREILLPTPNRRQKRMGIPFLNFKEMFAMSHTARVMTAMLLAIVLLVFGGGGATVFAAQSSLPAEPLYGLKIAVEDARLSSTSDPAASVSLSTEFAARRIDEMIKLAAAQRLIPPELLTRLDLHLTQALWNAARLVSSQSALEQIRQMTETQSMALAQASSMAPSEPGLEQAAQYLETARSLADVGLTDPMQFRNLMLAPNIPIMPPSGTPTMIPTSMPTGMPTMPTRMPSAMPSMMPSVMPTMMPSAMPTTMPTSMPTMMPTAMPTMMPTMMPTAMPTMMPTMMPTAMPTMMPTMPGGGGMP